MIELRLSADGGVARGCWRICSEPSVAKVKGRRLKAMIAMAVVVYALVG